MRTTPWLRLYTEILDDVKVQSLDPALFKCWVNLLCLQKEHRGTLPDVAEIAFRLRVQTEQAERIVSQLCARGLIDPVENGGFTIHNWDSRQYKTDGETSTDRVRRFRGNGNETQRNGDETVMKQRPSESESVSESISESGKASKTEKVEGTVTQSLRPPKMADLLADDIDGWPTFCEAWATAGAIKASTSDWTTARNAWRSLSHEQREGARTGILDRKGTDDPALSALPINYIQRAMWERGIRKNAAKSRTERLLDSLRNESKQGAP